MEECCTNCAYKKELVNYDYSSKGCHHITLNGYVCTLFSDEGQMIWMTGCNPDMEQCECFSPTLDVDREKEAN